MLDGQQYTGAATLELRPTKVSADCKVVSMVGLELQPGTPGCKIGDCAPYVETIRCVARTQN